MKLFINGQVYTGNTKLEEAFVIEQNKFTAVGKSEELKEKYKDAEIINLNNKFVSAGFNDSHMHMLSYGSSLASLALAKHTSSLKEMLEYMKAEVKDKKLQPNEWIKGRGWNQDFFTDEKRFPTRYDLDEVSTEYPICITRACGHASVINSKALEVIGVDRNTPQPDGGHFDLDEDGEPLGIFRETASQLITSKMNAVNRETIKGYLIEVMKKLNSFGITSAGTDDFGAFKNVDWHEILQAYKELEEEGKLTVRINEQCRFKSMDEFVPFVEEGYITGKGSNQFKIGPLKLMGDGSLGARTALMSEPYADDPSTCGIAVSSKKTLEEMIRYAHDHNIQTAVHTIGDGALDNVLSAVEKAQLANPRENHRHGIVHCQITRKEQLEKIAEMKMHCFAQTIFLDYDSRIVEARVGKQKALTSYNFKTLMNMGVTVSNGSDGPVEEPDVLAGIQCAVTRQTLKHDTEAYLPHEAFTVQEALNSYTSLGAYGTFEEDIKGKIEAGMLADFVILDENPIECSPTHIKDIKILETWMDGRQVYIG